MVEPQNRMTIHGRTIESVRRDFPLLSECVRRGSAEKPLTYLDNAATTQKPAVVIDRLVSFYQRENANVHRALYGLGEDATAAYESARRILQQFIGARSHSEIVFTSGTTAAINLVAYAWGRANVNTGDEIILTEMEHHSNLVPWQILAKERGAVLRFVPFLPDGSLDLQRFPALLSERTRLVAMAHVSNVFGTVNDVKRVIAQAHAAGVPVLLDGAQSVPHLPVDVQELDCDFLAFSGHKMCGPTGIGVLYAKEKLLEAMPPFLGGGEMIQAVWLDHATWNELPYKFEAGTPPIAQAVGLGAAAEYLSDLGMADILAYEQRLTEYATSALEGVPGLQIIGRAPGKSGVFSFNIEGLHSHDVAQYLDTEGVCVRSGHHCAHPLMRKLGISSTARASISFYNTADDIDRLVTALGHAKEYFA